MLLAAAVIPLASGTAPAAKGCMMEMVRPEKKAEALSAIALVEVSLARTRLLSPSRLLTFTFLSVPSFQFLAMISTVSVFGEIFAFLSEQGRPNHVFVLNGVSLPSLLAIPLPSSHSPFLELTRLLSSLSFPQTVAFVAGLILLLVRFPPRVRLDPETPQLSRTSTPNYLFPNYGTSGSGNSTPVGPRSRTPALIDYGDY